jgi:hypothetical protein
MWASARSATVEPVTTEELPEILRAVEQHRHRLAGLLDGLDDARRVASQAGIALLARDGGDLTALLVHLSDDLRATDDRLLVLAAELAQPS